MKLNSRKEQNKTLLNRITINMEQKGENRNYF